MLSIKTMLKLKSYKKKLSSFYWWLVKPLAYMEKLILKYKDNKYKLKQIEISKWSDEYAIKLYSKILIKQMVKREYRHGDCEEFIVAEWCDSDYNLKDIRGFVKEQKINKNLSNWGYKLPIYNTNTDRVEKLTELLRLELEKYEEIKCKYVVDKDKYGYSRSKGYIKTLVVEINKGSVE